MTVIATGFGHDDKGTSILADDVTVRVLPEDAYRLIGCLLLDLDEPMLRVLHHMTAPRGQEEDVQQQR